MRAYIRYEIGIRKYSSNIIKGIYLSMSDNNKQVEKFDIVLVSCLNKQSGDVFISNVFKTL